MTRNVVTSDSAAPKGPQKNNGSNKNKKGGNKKNPIIPKRVNRPQKRG